MNLVKISTVGIFRIPKVSIAIGGWNDSQGSRYGPMLTDPQKRRNFVEKAKQYVKKYNFDGLDLDLEVRLDLNDNSSTQQNVNYLFSFCSIQDAGKIHATLHGPQQKKQVLLN